jgi:hypothetical protein
MAEDPKKTLLALGKRLGVKDMMALNDFIDASIFTALEPILERVAALEYRLSQQSNQERVAQISPRERVEMQEKPKTVTPCFHIV